MADEARERQRPVGPSDRTRAIDILRAVAVLAVLFAHLPFSMRSLVGGDASALYPPSALLRDVLEYGQHGVLLFLVISGFCIHLRWAKHGDLQTSVPFVPFWKRRLLRLYPPYLVALLGSLAALFTIHGLLGGGTAGGIATSFGYDSWVQLLVDLALLLLLSQNLNDASHRIGNAPFWSLALEEQLYLLYFALLPMRRRLGWLRALAIMLFATLAWRLIGHVSWTQPPEFWFRIGPAYWFAWALGAVAVEAHVGRIKLPAWLERPLTAVVFIVLGVLCDLPASIEYQLPGARVVGPLLYAAGFFVIINAMCKHERERPGAFDSAIARAMYRIGIASYGIYLVHNLAYIPAKQAALAFGLPPFATLVVRLAAGLAAGLVFYWIIEKPFVARSQRIRIELKRPART